MLLLEAAALVATPSAVLVTSGYFCLPLRPLAEVGAWAGLADLSLTACALTSAMAMGGSSARCTVCTERLVLLSSSQLWD